MFSVDPCQKSPSWLVGVADIKCTDLFGLNESVFFLVKHYFLVFGKKAKERTASL